MLDTFRKRDNPRDHTRTTGPGVPAPRAPLVETQARAPEPANEAGRYERAATKPAQPEQPAKAALLAQEPQPEPQPNARSTRESARLTVGPDIKLKGAEITDCDTLIVEGQVDACMDSRVVEVAEQGIFRGKVQVDIAEIRGRFEGELTAHKQLLIRAGGRVAGKIRYGKISIDEGGQLSGDVATADPTYAEALARGTGATPLEHAPDKPAEPQRPRDTATAAGQNRLLG